MLMKAYTLKIIDVKRGQVIKTFKRESLSLSLNKAAGGCQMWSLLLFLEGRVHQQQSETTGEKGALANTIIAS